MRTTQQPSLSGTAAAFVALAAARASGDGPLAVTDVLVQAYLELSLCDGAGAALGRPGRDLEVTSVSADWIRTHLILEVERNEGPSVDAFEGSRRGSVRWTSAASYTEWPTVAPALVAAGVVEVRAVPLRLREQTVGVVTLYDVAGEDTGREHGGPGDDGLIQGLANMAAISILAQREAIDAERRARQLQQTLDDRVLLEAAKGILAESAHVPVAEVHQLLQAYCNIVNATLDAAAGQLTRGELTAGEVLSVVWHQGPSPVTTRLRSVSPEHPNPRAGDGWRRVARSQPRTHPAE